MAGNIRGTLRAHAAWVASGGRAGARADLRGADLGRCNLAHVNLARALLAGADLRGANLGAADLREADLTGADLRGAALSFTMGYNPIDLPRGEYRVNLTGARLDGANLAGLDLRGTGAPGTGGWTGPDDAEQPMPPRPLPPLAVPLEAPSEPPPHASGGAPAADALSPRAALADPTLLEVALPHPSVRGLDGTWRLALALARAFDPEWPADPRLALESKGPLGDGGVTRLYHDGPGPKFISAWHWRSSSPGREGDAVAERFGAAVHGLDAGRPSVKLSPARGPLERDRLTLDLAVFRFDRRKEARAVVEALLGAPFPEG